MTDLVPYEHHPEEPKEYTQDELNDALNEAVDDFLIALDHYEVPIPAVILDELETLVRAAARARGYHPNS